MDNDEFDNDPVCPKCGSSDVEFEMCWYCHGEGGFHECGEDTCCCLDKDEITEDCPECEGRGRLLICHGKCSAKAAV